MMAPQRFRRAREPHTRGGSKPCEEGCTCGKHDRSPMHNQLIGQGVRRTAAAKKQREREGNG